MSYWRYILVFSLALTLGIYIGSEYFPKTIEVPVEKTVVETKVEYKDRTEIQYVAKTTPSDSDIEITKAQPVVTASVNGKSYAFDLVQGETQKFDKGKLTVDQSSALSIDVSAQVEQQISTGVEKGIKKAFDEQKTKPQFKLGVFAEVGQEMKPEYFLRLSRQAESMDLDLRINQDKKVKFGITKWF